MLSGEEKEVEVKVAEMAESSVKECRKKKFLGWATEQARKPLQAYA